MPLYRRLPKRGFTNRNSLDIEAINLGALEAFDNDAEVTVEALLEKGIIKECKGWRKDPWQWYSYKEAERKSKRLQ